MSQDINFHYQTLTPYDTLLALAAHLQSTNYERSNIWKQDFLFLYSLWLHTGVITPGVKYANLITHNSD